MEINTEKLHNLHSQTYDRTFTPAPTPLDRYQRKEFRGTSLAEVFHENTKMGATINFSVMNSITEFLEEDAIQYAYSHLNPDYPNRPEVTLPEPSSLSISLEEVLDSRRSVREFTGEGIGREQLATLLGNSIGTNGERKLGVDDRGTPVVQQIRPYPSGGSLYPVEHYLLVLRGRDSLDPGLYYYSADEHVLRVLKRADETFREQALNLFGEETRPAQIQDAAAVVFFTGTFWRAMAKYGDRGYRFVLMEVGYSGQNVLLVAQAIGLGSYVNDAFDDRDVEAFLGVNGVDESIIGSIIIGTPARGETDE